MMAPLVWSTTAKLTAGCETPSGVKTAVKLPPNAMSFVPLILVIASRSPLVRSKASGVELIGEVGWTGVAAGARFECRTAPGVGQSADAGMSFIDLGASMALHLVAAVVVAADAAITVVDSSASDVTPIRTDESALRITFPPRELPSQNTNRRRNVMSPHLSDRLDRYPSGLSRPVTTRCTTRMVNQANIASRSWTGRLLEILEIAGETRVRNRTANCD